MHKMFKPKTKKSSEYKCPVIIDSLFKASLIPTVKYHIAVKNDDSISIYCHREIFMVH